jgi:hypothetical protein
MKTIRTSLVLLIALSFSATTFAKQGLLNKAKDAAKAKKADKPKKAAAATTTTTTAGTKNGTDKSRMAIKGSGVPATNGAKVAPTAPATTTTK